MVTTMNNTIATTITRYISPVPPNVKIVETKPTLGRIQYANSGALLCPENGGYYFKYPDGTAVAVASDRLCSVLDDSYLSLLFHYEKKGQPEEAKEVIEDLRKAGIDVDRLMSEASDEIKSGACVLDGGLNGDPGGDGQQSVLSRRALLY